MKTRSSLHLGPPSSQLPDSRAINVTTAARPGLDPDIPPTNKMQGPPTPLSVLGPQADAERQRIRQQFETGSSAREALRALCELADRNVQQIFGEFCACTTASHKGSACSRWAGTGGRCCFPTPTWIFCFCLEATRPSRNRGALISEFSRTLWDIGFRVSSAGRTLDECKRIEEDNAEFHLALLDRRFLAGDKSLFEKLDTKVLPASEKQARPFLLAQIHRLTRERLTRYGNTIFHLEPNVKESPGGMRDYQATIWLRQIVDEKREIRNITAAEEELSVAAVDFLSAIRCFLHYSNGRNDNTLTYELQAEAAEHALGVGDGVARTPSEWMRQYFRHARTLNRQLLRYLEQKAPAPQSLRQRLFNATRPLKFESGGGKYFVVRDGLLEVVDQPALADRAITYSLFAEAARTGTPLSREAERSIGYILTHPELPPKNTEISWATLARYSRL